MKDFTVKFSLSDSEYLTALRLVTGAVCSLHGENVDTIEDFKVCVTESVLAVKNCGFEYCTVSFLPDGACTVCGEGGTPHAGDNDLSLALISALVETCDIDRRGEAIERVTLKI